jgi:hypothetical protein
MFEAADNTVKQDQQARMHVNAGLPNTFLDHMQQHLP